MKNLFSYEGQRCLFAGCYSGMGEATAQVVESLGGEIVAVDIKKPTTFGYSSFLEVDLRDPAAIESMVSEVAAGGPIDRLFYCAGLPGGSFPAVDVVLVNFVGLRHTIETAAPRMTRGGAAVAISSGAGMAHMMFQDKINPLLALDDHAESREWVDKHQHEDWFEAYSFSKMATVLYTLRRGSQLPTEHGIRLNCTSPGPTDTPMMPHFIENIGADFMNAFPKPIGRNSTSEEQAWPLAFLNSDAASYVSGENLYTDGGASGGMMTGAIQPPTR